KEGGGIIGHRHPPADRFNAGQKMIYWIVVVGGTAVAVSGYFLMFPFYATNIAGMQVAAIVHGVVAVLFVAAMLGHIYIGTIGMEGAFEGMWDGTVDVNWAKENHSRWFEQERAEGHVGAPPPKGKMQAGEWRAARKVMQGPAGLPGGFIMAAADSESPRARLGLLYNAACASSAWPAGAAPARLRSWPKSSPASSHGALRSRP